MNHLQLDKNVIELSKKVGKRATKRIRKMWWVMPRKHNKSIKCFYK